MPESDATVTLPCPSCGETLTIGPELSTVACSACGAAHGVVRDDGRVTLAVVAEGDEWQSGSEREAMVGETRERLAALEAQVAKATRVSLANLVFGCFMGGFGLLIGLLMGANALRTHTRSSGITALIVGLWGLLLVGLALTRRQAFLRQVAALRVEHAQLQRRLEKAAAERGKR